MLVNVCDTVLSSDNFMGLCPLTVFTVRMHMQAQLPQLKAHLLGVIVTFGMQKMITLSPVSLRTDVILRLCGVSRLHVYAYDLEYAEL